MSCFVTIVEAYFISLQERCETLIIIVLGGADPQKQYADAVIEVLPTLLIPGDNEGKVLRVRLIMKEGVKNFSPVYLFDEGSTISWIPCGRKLTCSYPGIKFFYAPDSYFGHEVFFTCLLHILASSSQHHLMRLSFYLE